MNAVAWLICLIASIGFAFDIYELLMLPLIARPALQELLGPAAVPGSDLFQNWVGILFFVPAFAGGVFGLLGGYLTDRLGRRRVLTWSILIYAFSAFAAGFATSIEMLLVLRCFVFVGVCVEFVAAIAWLAELFPEREQRERVLGYTQAFSSIGGLLVAVASGLAARYAAELPAIPQLGWLPQGPDLHFDPHGSWRYTLMSGLIPAIPLIIIRPFLPESPSWEAKKRAGTLRRPSLWELFSPQLQRTTLITTLMFACSYGAAFGAIQHIQQIVPGLPEVRAKTEGMSPKEARQYGVQVASDVTKVQEVGGLFGRFLLALLVVRVLSQRKLIRLFQIPGLIVMPLVFGYAAVNSLPLLYLGIFLAGMLTVGQFSFWGNYLPRVYPVHLRGTGESFAANIGGRMLGTSFAAVTAGLAKYDFMPGEGEARIAYTAAIVGTAVYLAGLILSCFLPEPPADLTE